MIALIVYLNITLLVMFVVGLVTATGWYILYLFNFTNKVWLRFEPIKTYRETTTATILDYVVYFTVGTAYWGLCLLIFGVT